jgi:hypothetical protein
VLSDGERNERGPSLTLRMSVNYTGYWLACQSRAHFATKEGQTLVPIAVSKQGATIESLGGKAGPTVHRLREETSLTDFGWLALGDSGVHRFLSVVSDRLCLRFQAVCYAVVRVEAPTCMCQVHH